MAGEKFDPSLFLNVSENKSFNQRVSDNRNG